MMSDVAAFSRKGILTDLPVASPAPGIRIEFAEPATLASLHPDWSDLLERAVEANAFMSPALIQAAAESYPQSPIRVMLAWKTIEGRWRLTGVWAFAIGRPRNSLLPLRVLTAPPFSYGFLATPVVDRAVLEETLEAMLDRIAAEPDLPNTISLEAMSLDGATMAGLARVLASRCSTPCLLEQVRRPKLESDHDSKQYFENALSGSHRKKLRQRRRKLAEKGALSAEIVSDPRAMPKAIDDFLSLEASGWKGRRGTALLCNDADTAFFRTVFAALAQHGDASIHLLRLDQRPISMQLVLRAGDTAFTWKTAYDESFRDFSPGILLLEDYTAAFLDDNSIRLVDSCAQDDTSYMSAWTESRLVGDLWVDATPGGSPLFGLLAALETVYRKLRKTAKHHYLRLRRNRAR